MPLSEVRQLRDFTGQYESTGSRFRGSHLQACATLHVNILEPLRSVLEKIHSLHEAAQEVIQGIHVKADVVAMFLGVDMGSQESRTLESLIRPVAAGVPVRGGACFQKVLGHVKADYEA